ncbi:ectomycorrhiza-upregulated zf-MYND domain-containing protein [Lyophyllum atratum]|nr:ectomycorrhiza-upregulated zf-MYND domain-containing protein [Lyophyllum atratum]
MPQENCTKCNFPRDSLQKCSKCKTVSYCSKECQTSHWPVHKPMCRVYSPKEVWGVQMLSTGEAEALNISRDDWTKRCRHKLVTNDHGIFTRGELCPVTALFGIPLVIYSHTLATGTEPVPSKGENQAAVFLRIEPGDGFAPLSWQINDPGQCIVVRKDRKPLTLQVIETILEFHRSIIDGFGYPKDDGWAPVREYMTKASFQIFSRNYYKQQDEKGRPGFSEFYAPL